MIWSSRSSSCQYPVGEIRTNRHERVWVYLIYLFILCLRLSLLNAERFLTPSNNLGWQNGMYALSINSWAMFIGFMIPFYLHCKSHKTVNVNIKQKRKCISHSQMSTEHENMSKILNNFAVASTNISERGNVSCCVLCRWWVRNMRIEKCQNYIFKLSYLYSNYK